MNHDIPDRRHSMVHDGIHPDDFAAVSGPSEDMHIFAQGVRNFLPGLLFFVFSIISEIS
jgi:hypothetical protein